MKTKRSNQGTTAVPSRDTEHDSLTRYVDEVRAHGLLDAKQELELAERIEALEIAHWRALLSYAPALKTVRAALAPHMDVPAELHALQGRKAGQAGSRARALALAAKKLRKLDVARVALAEVDARVRTAFQGKRRSEKYLARVEQARLAQQHAKNRFMTANLRLVIRLARRYDRGLMPFADLVQEGNLGLMRAVERFDHRKGFRFSTYATWWIRHALNRALSDKARLVRIPVHILDDAQRVARASRELMALTGETPSMSQLTERTGMDEEKLALVASHAGARMPASLDRKLGEDSDSSLLDRMADPNEEEPETRLDRARWTTSLEGLFSVLPPMEADILRFRFGLDDGEELTLREIGLKYNLSRERIRQLQEHALAKLRAHVGGAAPMASAEGGAASAA